MKIGIDSFGCNHGQSGSGSYLLNCIENYIPQEDIDLELFGFEMDRFVYINNAQASYVSVDIKDNVQSIRKWHKKYLNLFIKKSKYDVVVYPAFEHVLPLPSKKVKSVAVINSLISKQLEDHKKSYKNRLFKGLKKVDKIIAGTEFIKNDLIKFQIPEEKIIVISNGIDHKLFFPFIDPNDEYININPFAIKRPYFVYGSRVSGSDKKHIQLIKAFERFKKHTNAPHRLVIAGSIDESVTEVQNAIAESEYAGDIFLTGYFPHNSFAALYAGAAACVFPSVNEGVGLPILEAMACGIPVLCSEKGALKEVGGDVPLYFNSDDVNEIAELMEKIIENEDLRLKMIESGLQKAALYNWVDTITETIEVIKSL